MSTEFGFAPIPKNLLPILGEPDPETRLFRQAGTKEEGGRWFDAMMEIGGGGISPGGVSMFAPVSRAAVYKRIKEGRLTAFCFHEIETHRGFFGGEKKVRTSPFIYVPISEAKAWGEELKKSPSRVEAATADDDGDIFEWDSPWRKKKLKEFRNNPLR